MAIMANDGNTGGAPSGGSGKHITVIGWIVFALGLYAVNKTKIGHEIIFYSLILILIYLFTANYKNIIPLLEK